MLDFWIRANRYWMDVATMQSDAWATIAHRQPMLLKEMQAWPLAGPETVRMVAEKLAAGQEVTIAMMKAMASASPRSARGAARRALSVAEATLGPVKRRTGANAKRLGKSARRKSRK